MTHADDTEAGTPEGKAPFTFQQQEGCVATRGIGPLDARRTAEVRVDVVKTDGRRGNEAHPAACEQRTVTACTGTDEQGVGVPHQLRGEVAPLGINHLIGKSLDDTLQVGYFLINDYFHGKLSLVGAKLAAFLHF